VRTQVFGSGSTRHLTTEWFDSTFTGSLERLRFQVQIFETTGVVEFHYCTLAVNGGDALRTAGNQATVGVENLAGTSGTLHSFDTAAAVSTANALRFTP
jgi:hypothetical protein